SLRHASYNTAALRALQILAPAAVKITLANIGELPLFNPDRAEESIPSLAVLKAALRQASGLIIASPEYAHGISGPLKNALDWLVSGEEFPAIPIMLVNTSPRAHHALDALKEVLRTMSGKLVDAAEVAIPLLGSGLDANGIVADPAMTKTLQSALHAFCDKIRELRVESGSG
ncbi:MAG: NAD(P)H-dependent oxidoreductase, partial [Caldilineaceae bacterium]|nr:NAD(P)H-dependent oxidoreductase [Caldilineaceae bacterium]